MAFGDTIFGSADAYAGVMRWPAAGRLDEGAAPRMVIQPVPDLFRSPKFPV
jgi:hypothetical protein